MKQKLKIIPIFSGGASAIRYLIENDPNYNTTYQFPMAIVNKKGTSGQQFCNSNGLMCFEKNTKQFCRDNGYDGPLKDMPDRIREKYFADVLECISQAGPNMVLLSGFMFMISPPLLGSIPIGNVHPADLSIKDDTGKPKYVGVGDKVIKAAFDAGEKSTASTFHLINEKMDEGPIVCISDHVSFVPGVSLKNHQEKMKFLCDGPACMKAIQMIYDGEFVLPSN